MPFEGSLNDVNMPTSKEKRVKDFMIEYGIRAVLESSHCEVKYNRTIEDFIEYLKYLPKSETELSLAALIVEFFGSDKEFPFESVKKIREKKDQADKIETDLTKLGVD